MVICCPAAVAQVSFDDYVRLHIIAEDDTEQAQDLKMKVRDGIIESVQALFAGCDDPQHAWDAACRNIGCIEAWAQKAAFENGYEGRVTASAEMCTFPDREWAGMTVPAGEYRTVRVVIGEGIGQNWWCVLYPSIGMPEGYEPGMKVEFYSSFVRWIKNLFGGSEND
jgi:stage II sporulation protein R